MLIWLGQKMNPSAPLYNMALSFELSFAVKVQAFEEAVESCVAASEALRTTFASSENGPRQTVLPHAPRKSEFVDLSGPDAVERFRAWANDRCQQQFKLQECLYDSVLVQLGPTEFRWFLNQHHLITDAWSVATVYRQVSDRYISSQKQNPAYDGHDALYSKYREFELQQRNVSSNHWDQRAAATAIAPGLYGRPSQAPSSGTTRTTRHINGSLAARLRTAAASAPFLAFTHHLSCFNLFATLLVAWQHRVTGQNQITLGTPSHNRPTAGGKATIGLMMELLPLQVEVGTDETFASLSRLVQQETGQFLRHARPGSTNAELLRAFNVVLNYIPVSFGDFAGRTVRSEWLHPRHGDPAHHLRLQVHDFDGADDFQLHFDMNSDLYDEQQQVTASDHFLTMLDALLTNCEQRIDSIRLPSPDARDTTTTRVKGCGDEPVHRSVLEQFEAQAVQRPHEVAIVDGTEQWAFEELDARANQIADLLRNSGVNAGDRVVLVMPRSTAAIATMLAVWKCEAAFTPIDISFPAARMDFIIQDLDPAAVVVTTATAHLASDSMPIIVEDALSESFESVQTSSQLKRQTTDESTAYVLYTSGSTGEPKGVVISHRAIANYVNWACRTYGAQGQLVFPLFTSLSFDLTLTSILVPLASGGRIVVYPEASAPADITLLNVIRDNIVNIIKLTPSHLELLRDESLNNSDVQQLIIGGEDLKSELAANILRQFDHSVQIHNEYGPTEATIGCVFRTFDPEIDKSGSVPIGVAIDGMETQVLNDQLVDVPDGVTGELYLSGIGLADEYWRRPELSEERFITNPMRSGENMYRTGDLVRRAADGVLTYIGRTDGQIKVRGVRIETGEIEAALQSHPGIKSSFVGIEIDATQQGVDQVQHCVDCGLPSNYPDATFDIAGQCSHCAAFDQWKHKAEPYFRDMADLQKIFDATRSEESEYDCMSLLSGGKDSTFALCQLVDMGFDVLAFTLDNGYLSSEAKENIDRVVNALGVDHIYGSTPAMNAIFVDSLKRHGNVCQGCFKTVYTLSMQEAKQRGIRHIVTGLSRGQLFETRLSEELFQQAESNLKIIDLTIQEARRAYHRVDDAVKQHLNTDIFSDDEIFEELNFIDFFRYCDVSLSEMLSYLAQRVAWIRPADTGRSTNCLINDVGIHVHKQKRGFHNYAFPYSWDVRMGHKTREEAMQELDDEIELKRVEQILKEIGYSDNGQSETTHNRLMAWYVANDSLTEDDVRRHVETKIPPQMMPSRFVQMQELPLSINGKLDQSRLPQPSLTAAVVHDGISTPKLTELEEIVMGIWKVTLRTTEVGLHDNFFEIGGDSLLAMSVVASMNQTFEVELPISRLFEASTVAAISARLEEVLQDDIIGNSRP